MRDILDTAFSWKWLAACVCSDLAVQTFMHKNSVKPGTLASWQTIACEEVKSGCSQGQLSLRERRVAHRWPLWGVMPTVGSGSMPASRTHHSSPVAAICCNNDS